MLPHNFLQSILAKFVCVFVIRFGDAICINNEDIARLSVTISVGIPSPEK